MTSDDFDRLLDARLAKTRAVLASKAGEYASDRDRLHNFKAAGRIRNRTPVEALAGMWVKHLVSIEDLIDDVNRGDLSRLKKPGFLDEKIGDAINYLFLLEALLTELCREYDVASAEDVPEPVTVMM